MSIQQILDSLNGYASDISVNLGNILLEEFSIGLSKKQIYGIVLSSAYSTRNEKLISLVLHDVQQVLNEDQIRDAKASATIMAMNNIYYRAIHFIADDDILKKQSGMKMQIMQNHNISQIDFELYSLAVSVINGCEYCVRLHTKKLLNGGITKEGIQSTIRIASVITGTAQAFSIT
jgi:alkyl hydroperoxide reductase subunit D